jgi:hypothetical protein
MTSSQVLNELCSIIINKFDKEYKNGSIFPKKIQIMIESYLFGENIDLHFFIYVLNYEENKKCSFLDYIYLYNPKDNESINIDESIKILYSHYFSLQKNNISKMVK